MRPVGANAARIDGDRRHRVMAGGVDITDRRRPGAGTVIAPIATAGAEMVAGAEETTAGAIATAIGKVKNTAALSGGVSLKSGFAAQSASRQPQAADNCQQRR